MKIQNLSTCYVVRALTLEDVEAIYALELGNPLFFVHCPPAVTRQSILEDIGALPPCMTYDDKFYVGFFREEKLVAILDLILRYPDQETAFIGLFMVEAAEQGHGVGSAIIGQLSAYLHTLGFLKLRLAFAKGNPQSEKFWQKNGFSATGEEFDRRACTRLS